MSDLQPIANTPLIERPEQIYEYHAFQPVQALYPSTEPRLENQHSLAWLSIQAYLTPIDLYTLCVTAKDWNSLFDFDSLRMQHLFFRNAAMLCAFVTKLSPDITLKTSTLSTGDYCRMPDFLEIQRRTASPLLCSAIQIEDPAMLALFVAQDPPFLKQVKFLKLSAELLIGDNLSAISRKAVFLETLHIHSDREHQFLDFSGLEKNQFPHLKWLHAKNTLVESPYYSKLFLAMPALIETYDMFASLNQDDCDSFFDACAGAALRGHIVAQNLLALCYNRGIGIEKSDQDYHDWHQKSASRGNIDSIFSLALFYEKEGSFHNLEKAIELYTVAARHHHILAQNNLANYYLNIKHDYKKAIEIYQKALKQNEPIVFHNVGIIYANGLGTEQNWSLAIDYYTKAATAGYASSQNNLANCYLNGSGVEKDPKQAFEWFKKAAKQGLKMAQTNLSICYKDGIGVEQNLAKAKKWLKRTNTMDR